jgi:hypothetical protein
MRPLLTTMAERWTSDSQYTHGYYVPIFASALRWMRRLRLQGVEVRPSTWGLAAPGLGAAL